MSDEENFEVGESGGADTYPVAAGKIKKGAYCMLKDQPCKVTDYSTSKAGKHGHAKASIVGNNIFTGKRVEDSCPTSHNIAVPFVKKIEYTLIDIAEDGFLTLLTDSGETKEDAKLPEDEVDLTADIKKQFEEAGDDKEVCLTLMTAMGQEKVISVRVK